MKNIMIWIAVILVLSLLAGCGTQTGNAEKQNAAPTAEEPGVGMPNPVKSSSAEEIAQRFGVEMKAPEGAEEISFVIIEGDLPLAQMGYSLDGIVYNYRVAKAEAYTDIAGMYYDWESAGDGPEGSIRLIAGGPGVIDRFDADGGTVYSLSIGHGASAEMLKAAARLLWGGGSDEELTAMLDAIRARVFPGTAGSSLSAAACAAELADFFVDSAMSPDTVDRVVQTYLAALSEEDAQLAEMQLDSVVGAFSSLTGENGSGLLEDCGYESAHFPWSGDNVRDCFVALLGSD